VAGEARYRLGPRAAQMSSASSRQKAFRQLAKRYVNQAAAATGEAVHATVFVQGHAVTVAIADSVPTSLRPVVFLGTKRPAYSSASGRVFLAFQPEHLTEMQLRQPMVARTPHTMTSRAQLLQALGEIRSRGYAFDQKEYLENVYCVAVPVVDYSTEVIGTLSVSVTENAADSHRMETIVALLQRCAHGLSRNLGYEGEHPTRAASTA
jgi:IclR family transcriptional regulator, KDG regulon repressor